MIRIVSVMCELPNYLIKNSLLQRSIFALCPKILGIRDNEAPSFVFILKNETAQYIILSAMLSCIHEGFLLLPKFLFIRSWLQYRSGLVIGDYWSSFSWLFNFLLKLIVNSVQRMPIESGRSYGNFHLTAEEKLQCHTSWLRYLKYVVHVLRK